MWYTYTDWRTSGGELATARTKPSKQSRTPPKMAFTPTPQVLLRRRVTVSDASPPGPLGSHADVYFTLQTLATPGTHAHLRRTGDGGHDALASSSLGAVRRLRAGAEPGT